VRRTYGASASRISNALQSERRRHDLQPDGEHRAGAAPGEEGQVYCPDCLAKDLEQSPQTVKEAMDALADLPTFPFGACPCGQGGIMYVGL